MKSHIFRELVDKITATARNHKHCSYSELRHRITIALRTEVDHIERKPLIGLSDNQVAHALRLVEQHRTAGGSVEHAITRVAVEDYLRSCRRVVQRQPWPNHNFCVGCTGETCKGCGTEPQERRKTPAAVEQRVMGAHPDLAAPYGPVKWQEADREKLRDALAEALGDSTYCCTRVWNAWNVGTMGPDDFVLAAEDDEVLDGLTAAALLVVAGGSTSESQS